MIVNEKMKDRALTRLKLYWRDEHADEQGHPFLMVYSLDYPRDRKNQEASPGMDRLHRVFVIPNLGKFRVALFYRNVRDGMCLRAYDYHGHLISQQYLNKNKPAP